MSTHLRPEQFNDLLLGIIESETTAHLGACPQCRTEIEAMRQTLASFRGAAICWGETAAKPVELTRKHRARPIWTQPARVLATAAILLAVVIPYSMWRGRSNNPGAADGQAQIARDNQLLANIQSDIGETTPVPLQPLHISY